MLGDVVILLELCDVGWSLDERHGGSVEAEPQRVTSASWSRARWWSLRWADPASVESGAIGLAARRSERLGTFSSIDSCTVGSSHDIRSCAPLVMWQTSPHS